MGILLGLAAALLFGSSDFTGGLASRRFGPLQVTVIGSAVGTVLAWATLGLLGGPGFSLRAVAWGLASGLADGAGTLVLYRGMARGQMSVVGPVSALGAAVVPVVAGVALGDRPSLLAVGGVLVAMPAIVLIAASGSVRGKLADPKSLFDGLAAGLAFGISFIALAQAGRNAGLWPVACEQAATLLLTLAVTVKSREPLRSPVRVVGLPILAGASAMAASLAYFYSTHFSMLAIAAVLTSLYPGVTVLLARTLLHERFGPAQRAGLGLAAVAIIAIAVN